MLPGVYEHFNECLHIPAKLHVITNLPIVLQIKRFLKYGLTKRESGSVGLGSNTTSGSIDMG